MPILRHLLCGPEGARTPDPLLAKQMFFLLNYRPIVVCSHHVKELFTSYFALHTLYFIVLSAGFAPATYCV